MADSKCEEEKDWEYHLEELIHVFKPALLDSIRASHIVWLLTIKEVQDKTGVIVMKENAGDFNGAADELLEAIKSSDQPGKWQMFIDALREVEDTEVLRILLEEKSQPKKLNNDDNRQIINIFSQKILKFLKLSPLLNTMFEKGLIINTDLQLLRSMIENGKNSPANGVLLLIMHRHSEDWYKIFMDILCDDDNHFELAKRIDEEFCIKRKNSQAEMSSPVSSDEQQREPLERERVKTTQSGINVDASLLAGVKGMDTGQGDPQSEDTSAGVRVPVSAGGEATCQCRCCAQVLSRVTSLQGEVDEMKALVRFLVNKFSGEDRK